MSPIESPIGLPQHLVNAIQHAQAISFDIFDTVLIRATEKPTDVFYLLAQEMGINDIHAFAAARIEAEKRAREIAWQQRGAVEISLEEIYNTLSGNQLIERYDTKILLEHERSVEFRLCRRNPGLGELFDWVMKLGKRVGFISDMYLDKALIASMLSKHGYRGYDFLWISSIEGVTKANGGLFQLALKQLAISASDLVHIGDNFDSDIKQARAAGIYAHHVPKCIDLFKNAKIAKRVQYHLPRNPQMTRSDASMDPDTSTTWKVLWRGLLAAQAAKKESNFWFDLGYSHVGILLLGFSLWINKLSQQSNLTRIYFLARDGHIMHKVHQCLWERGWTEIPGQYLFASRRALNFPAITAIDEPTCDFLVSGISRLTVGEFLTRIGLALPESEALIQEAGFSGSHHLVSTGEDYGRLRMLFRLLAPRLLELAGHERNLLRDYFQQEQIFEQRSIGIVDIGWHGSLQESIDRLFKLYRYDSQLTGFYLGTFSAAKARVDAGAKQHAFICELGEPAEQLAIIKASVEVFEWFFCAPHGSVVSFEQTPEGIKPKFGSIRNEQYRIDTAQQMQAGALQFIDDALNCFSILPPPITSDLALSLVKDLLVRPTAKEAREIGDIYHSEGFGNVEKARPIAHPSAHPCNPFAWTNLLKDYRKSFWRAGYRRRMWPDFW
ncbi:MAG: HAD-IA family hydrolase [Nitrosomonas sp.]|nr:MAG: HAD-IA family hydrolase [Nitrosomonas sp.]